MRTTWLSILAVAAVGCANQDAIHLDIASTLNARTNGLALHGNGATGLAAMPDNGQSCAFDAAQGVIIRDFDVAGGAERVVDVLGETVAAVSPVGVHTIEGQWDESPATFALDGVVDARLLDGGFATLADGGAGCSVDFHDGSGLSVPVDACDALAMAVDRATSTAFLATGDDVIAVDASGARSLGVAATALSWDAAFGQLYVSTPEGVGAVDPLGGTKWFTSSDGAPQGVHAMGELGAVGAMVQAPNGTASIVFFDGVTGDVRSNGRIPSIADMSISEDGRRLALILDDTVHFYDISVGPRQVDFDLDIPEPVVTTD